MEGSTELSVFDKHLNQLSVTSSESAGAFSKSDGTSFQGTLAEGRTGQSPHKNWLLLAFAKRVIDGDAKPHETAFMTALMAADIPEWMPSDELGNVINTVSFLSCIREMDASDLIEAAAIKRRGGE